MLEEIFLTDDGFDAIRIALGVLSLAAAIAYQVIEHRPPSALRTGLKTASIGLLVPLPLLAGTALPFVLLAAAFLFAAPAAFSLFFLLSCLSCLFAFPPLPLLQQLVE